MRLICEICGEMIGEISLEGTASIPASPGDVNGKPAIEALRRPIKGSMVGSPDPFHGFPAPFDPSVTWEFMFCPYSNHTHRPFTATEEPKQLLTHKGMIDIPEREPILSEDEAQEAVTKPVEDAESPIRILRSLARQSRTQERERRAIHIAKRRKSDVK